MAEEAVNLDDIDLEIDPEEELRRLAEGFVAEKEETEDEPAEEEATEEEATEEEATEEEATEDETTEEEPKVDSQSEAQKQLLEELRAERQRLQDQLNELTVKSTVESRKLAELSEAMKKAQEPVEEPGPSPEQILGYIEQRINETETALTQAEEEDVSKAPALRKQLRQLERYYTDYKTQVVLEAAKGPDPMEIVQRATAETQQLSRFDGVTRAIKTEYPMLDPDNKDFNEALRDEIYDIYKPKLAAGADPVEALIKATTLVARANGIMSASQLAEWAAKQAEEQKVAEKKEEAPKPKQKTAERKVQAVKKNLKAAEDAAPNIAKEGTSNRHDGLLGKYDFEKMGINEFMRLSEAEEEQIEAALALYEDE